MVVDDLYVFSTRVCPAEAQAELVVDSDTVLTGSISSQFFKSITRRHAQIVQDARDLELSEFAQRHTLDADKALDARARSEGCCIRFSERNDQGLIVTRRVIDVKRDYPAWLDRSSGP